MEGKGHVAGIQENVQLDIQDRSSRSVSCVTITLEDLKYDAENIPPIFSARSFFPVFPRCGQPG